VSFTVIAELDMVTVNIAFMIICGRCGVGAYVKVQSVLITICGRCEVGAYVKVQSVLITISLVFFLKYEKVGF
jgi:hypothetical protein